MTTRADEPVFLSDAEIAKRLSVGERVFRIASQQPGFPPKKRIWGGKRYWPAVRQFLDRTNGVIMESPTIYRGEENWDDDEVDHSERAGAPAASSRER